MLLLLLLKIVEQVEKKENKMGSDIIKISHLTKNFGDVKAVNAGYVVILDKRSLEKDERR